MSAAPGTGTATRARASIPKAGRYGYSFSKELLQEWDWKEHFSPQPDTLEYLNYVEKASMEAHAPISAHPFINPVRTRLRAGGSRIRTRGPTLRRAALPKTRHSDSESFGRRERHHFGGAKVREPASTAGEFYDGRMRQITNSQATPRTSTSKSRPCTGGRAVD